MKILNILGLVDESEEDGTTKPVKTIMLKNEFSYFISDEFKGYLTKLDYLLTPKNSKLSPKENLEKNTLSDTLDEHLRSDDTIPLPPSSNLGGCI